MSPPEPRPPFPDGARVAGVIWAVFGFGFLVFVGYAASSNHAPGGPVIEWLGPVCVGLVLGGPFAVGGCRVASGAARDTLVLSIVSIPIGAWFVCAGAVILAMSVAESSPPAPGNVRAALWWLGAIEAVVGCGWLLAAGLGFATRSRYRAWRTARRVGERAVRVPVLRPSAVWQATTRGDADELRRLLAAGADPNAARSDGTTLLHAAARHGHAGVVEVLLAAGADANRPDPHGNGPLWVAVHEACQSGRTDGNLEVIRQLVAAGANPDYQNRYGRTPRENAEARDRLIAGLLPATG